MFYKLEQTTCNDTMHAIQPSAHTQSSCHPRWWFRCANLADSLCTEVISAKIVTILGGKSLFIQHRRDRHQFQHSTLLINQSIKQFLTSCYHKDHTEKQLIYKTRPGYESRNRCSSSRFLKVRRDGAEVKSTDRSFHGRAPATRKKQHPTVGDLTAGTKYS